MARRPLLDPTGRSGFRDDLQSVGVLTLILACAVWSGATAAQLVALVRAGWAS